MEKKLNPNDDSNNLDVDNLMSTMGQDIDYIFRELSTFEQGQQKKAVGGTDLPANPSPRIGGSDSSDSDEQSLIATAKIKYTLGQLSSTLKQDEKRPRASSNADPLLIDEDGFLVQEEINLLPMMPLEHLALLVNPTKTRIEGQNDPNCSPPSVRSFKDTKINKSFDRTVCEE